MKKLLIFTLVMSAFNAFAATPRTQRNLKVLGPEMKARIAAKEMKVVDIVVVQGAAPKISKPAADEVVLSTVKQPLVIENSCRASVFYEGGSYDYDEVCVSDGACSCDQVERIEYRTANIAVDVKFDTDFAFEIADIAIELIAINPYTGASFTITSEYYGQESDIFGIGDNTVIFNIDEAYYTDYNIEARVSIGDSAGAACTVFTNTL